jgi:hypothetical protein
MWSQSSTLKGLIVFAFRELEMILKYIACTSILSNIVMCHCSTINSVLFYKIHEDLLGLHAKKEIIFYL